VGPDSIDSCRVIGEHGDSFDLVVVFSYQRAREAIRKVRSTCRRHGFAFVVMPHTPVLLSEPPQIRNGTK
jgi:hypothetical protein